MWGKLFLVCLCLILGVNGSGEEITEVLGNGCTLTSPLGGVSDDEHVKLFFKQPLPHLNCSGTGRKRFDLSQVSNTTKSITFTHNEMIEFYVDDLKPFPLLESLEFQSNQLSRIIPSAEGLTFNHTYKILFNNNRLTKIPNEALKSFPGLTIFSINDNKLSTMDDDDFQYNTKLEGLMMGFNPFREPFNDRWMRKLQFKYLVIKSSGLTEIPYEIRNQKNLAGVDLSNNLITRIEEGQFSGCESLYWLSLTMNRITRIDPSSFIGVSKLNQIELSDNLLTNLEEGTFDGIKLDELRIEMYENPFVCDCRMEWFKQWTDYLLQTDVEMEIRYKCFQPLRLHGKSPQLLTPEDFTCTEDEPYYKACNASYIPVEPTEPSEENGEKVELVCPERCSCYDKDGNLYAGIDSTKQSWSPWQRSRYPRVDCLDAGYDRIPENMPDDVKMLVMSGNRITNLHISHFIRFTQLEQVSLKNNQIKNLINDMDGDEKMEHLSYISLQYNNITSVTSQFLKHFPKLNILSIYHNKITNFPADLFAYNKEMNRLYLGPNPVRSFDESFLIGMDLVSLSLRNLSLTRVPAVVQKMVNLTYIDMSDNRITLIKSGTFSKHYKLWRMDLENNKISKMGTNAFNGALKLRSLLLSENQIETLQGNIFSDLAPKSLNVELWENPINCNCSMKPFKQWLEKRASNDPTTDIRFRCFSPKNMVNKVSDELNPDDFVCSSRSSPTTIQPSIQTTSLPPVCECQGPSGHIAVAVLLTFVLTCFICLICWKLCFKVKYGHLLRYAKQRNNYEEGGVLPDEEF